LVNKLLSNGDDVTVISRSRIKVTKLFDDKVRAIESFEEIPKEEIFDAVINLAGENIAAKRWSDEQKQKLIDSRINNTSNLISYLSELKEKPKVLVNASAIGYYGSHEDESLTENSKPNSEFTHILCKKWEDEAKKAEGIGIRTVIYRLGVVLGKGGGTIGKLELPFKLGLGGKIGSGEQYFSWVHLDDVVNAFIQAAESKKMKNIYNLTAPNAVTNKKFTKELGTALNRPTIIPMPEITVKLLFGEMGETLLLNGQRVFPKKLLDEGFKFKFEKIDEALAEIF